jgi:acetyl esterase
MYLKRRYFTQPPPPEVAGVRDLRASGPHGPIPLRLYRPLGPPDTAVLPVLVYYHGGGHVLGDLETHDTLCRDALASRSCS